MNEFSFSSQKEARHPQQREYVKSVRTSWKTICRLSYEEYPNLFIFLHKRNDAIFNRLRFVFSLAEYTDNQLEKGGHCYFFYPLSNFAHYGSMYARTELTWEKTVVLFTCVGLIDRYMPTSKTATQKYEKKALQTAKEQSHKRSTAFYSIPEYTEEHLYHMEEQARKWIEGHGNCNSFSKSTIIDIFGNDLANKIYQDKRRKPWKKTKAERDMAHILIRQLILNGYTTRNRLIAEVAEDYPNESTYTARETWDRAHYRILQEVGARHHRPTQEEKEKYNLKGEGWIIKKK